jgi:hypothetical protein
MANLLNIKVMWNFQHAPSCVAGGYSSQHVQQMGDDEPQPIGFGSDTMIKFVMQKYKCKIINKQERNRHKIKVVRQYAYRWSCCFVSWFIKSTYILQFFFLKKINTFFLYVCTRGKEIRISDFCFIKRNLNRLSYLLETLFLE